MTTRKYQLAGTGRQTNFKSRSRIYVGRKYVEQFCEDLLKWYDGAITAAKSSNNILLSSQYISLDLRFKKGLESSTRLYILEQIVDKLRNSSTLKRFYIATISINLGTHNYDIGITNPTSNEELDKVALTKKMVTRKKQHVEINIRLYDNGLKDAALLNVDTQEVSLLYKRR